MADDKAKTQYPGAAIDASWDGRLCIHVGECVRANNDLFMGGRQPWGLPDAVSTEEVVATVNRCPTGALSYVRKDGGPQESASPTNTVVVSNNGPYYLRGDLDVQGAAADMEAVRFRAALCRCGKSSQKPFCDGTHETVGFVDRGAVGDTGPGMGDATGPLQVVLAKAGPLLLRGPVALVAASGRVAWQGTNCALCRCGESKNKPFCDGSHKGAGFTGE
jgi:CDGSH-type Zn-finger protein/uncharacterized Fe-S cluster protein YjdI